MSGLLFASMVISQFFAGGENQCLDNSLLTYSLFTF